MEDQNQPPSTPFMGDNYGQPAANPPQDPNNPGTYEPVAGNTYTPDEEAILWFRITATDSSGESAVAYHNVIVNF